MRSIHHHPSQHQISALARGRQSAAAARAARSARSGAPDADAPVRCADPAAETRAHLSDGCTRCATALRQAAIEEVPALRQLIEQAILSSDEPETDTLSELADRTVAWVTVLEAERAAARDLEETLVALPPEDRAETVRAGGRYRNLGLVHHLMDRAREEGVRDPARARNLAELAVEAAESLGDERYPTPMVAEARALAWAVLGNALRLVSDLFGSERAFQAARSHLAEPSIHPVIRADVQALLGSLRIDQTRYAEAIELLDSTVEVYRLFSEPQSEGRALMKMAKAVGEGGDPERAVALLQSAETLVDVGDDRELVLVARQARVALLHAAGRIDEAAALYERLVPEYDAVIDDFVRRQRLRWVGARVAHALGDLDRAEAELVEVRQRFEEHEEAYDFALVSLDLAILYMEQRRTGEVRALAEEMLPIFTSRRIHQHALAALVLFQRAAEAETATVAYVQDLALFLHQARNNPYLAYDPTD